MKLKENTTQRKLRGGYYTPQKLADYITKITLKDKKKILEPSCGDGSFLKSIKNILDNNDYNIEKIDAIEYIEEEANKSKRILYKQLKRTPNYLLIYLISFCFLLKLVLVFPFEIQLSIDIVYMVDFQ